MPDTKRERGREREREREGGRETAAPLSLFGQPEPTEEKKRLEQHGVLVSSHIYKIYIYMHLVCVCVAKEEIGRGQQAHA